MASALHNVVAKIRRIAALPRAGTLDDRELLQQFAAGDEAAFTVLVERYGGLVMGVCRRVVQHVQDAEDAFQATFMVLARKAHAVAWQESIANWLHGVAYRISCKIRSEKARRRVREHASGESSRPASDPSWRELQAVLDEELDRLPAKYRTPLLLCCLEGKSRDEAAAQLGWSLGSLKGRLERGRELLRGRLARRGLTLSAGLSVLLFGASRTSAAVPLTLTMETVRAGMHFVAGQAVLPTQVLSLAQGALHTMFVTKLKIAAAILLTLGALGVGTGYWIHTAQAGDADAGRPSELQQVAFTQQRDGEKPGDRPRQPEKPVKRDGDRERPGERPGPRDGEVRAVLKQIDIAKGTLTVTTGGDRQPAERALKFAANDVKLSSASGRPIKLADLAPDTLLYLRLSGETTVTSIRAEEPRGIGVLAAVDADKNTIALRTEQGAGKPVPVAKDAAFSIDGKAAKLGDFKADMRVVVTLSLDRSTVLGIQAGQGEGEVGRERGAEGRGLTGYIKAIDVAKLSLTLRAARDPDGRTFDIAKDAKVYVRKGRKVNEGKIADLAVQNRVFIHFDEAQKTIHRIDVLGPADGDRPDPAREAGRDPAGLQGVLSDIDPGKSTIVLHHGGRENPQTHTFAVSKGAKIVIRQGNLTKEATLADLALKMNVIVRLDDAKKVVTAIDAIVSTTLHGVITEIEKDKLTVTVQTREVDAEARVYPLAKDVKVVVRREREDGKEVKLADLPANVSATLQFDDEKKLVQLIAVQIPLLRTRVKAVDPAKNTLTLAGEREDRVLEVSRDADILIKGKAAKLADVTGDMDVVLTFSLDRSRVVGIHTPSAANPRERERERE